MFLSQSRQHILVRCYDGVNIYRQLIRLSDLRRSTSDIETVDQHQVTGGGDAPYTPSGETTLYAAGTPVVTGPAGTAIIIHGTPVMDGLPAAVIDGTTYALEAGGR